MHEYIKICFVDVLLMKYAINFTTSGRENELFSIKLNICKSVCYLLYFSSKRMELRRFPNYIATKLYKIIEWFDI